MQISRHKDSIQETFHRLPLHAIKYLHQEPCCGDCGKFTLPSSYDQYACTMSSMDVNWTIASIAVNRMLS